MANLNATVQLNTVWGAVTGVREAMSVVEKGTADALSSGTTRGMEAGAKKVMPRLESAVKRLHEAGFQKSAKVARQEYGKLAKQREADERRLAQMNARLQRKNISDAEKRAWKEKKKNLQKEAKERERAQERLLKKAEQAAKRQQQQSQRGGGGGGDGGGGGWGDVESPRSRGRRSGGRVRGRPTAGGGRAAGAALRGGASAAARGGAAAASGMGGAIAGLGAAAAGIAAVVGPLAAAAGLMAKAYNQTKALNKAVLDNISAIDMGAFSVAQLYGDSESLSNSLEELRTNAQRLGVGMRMSGEEVIGLMAALNQAGLTLGEFAAEMEMGANNVQAQRMAVRLMHVGMSNFNASADEMAGFLNTLFRDLNMDLSDVNMTFAQIAAGAELAGMSTKDFFTVINETSSGMALYNYRIQDTVGLFSDMVEILGEDMAKAQIGVRGAFRDMSTEDRRRTAYQSGTENMRGIMMADARGSRNQFMSQNDNLLTSGSALASAGVLGNQLYDTKTKQPTGHSMVDLEALGGLTREAFGALEHEIRGYGDDQSRQAARDLRDLYELARSGTGQGDVTRGMGSLSQTGELAAQLTRAQGIMGDTPISQMEGLSQQMFESMTGMSGEQLDVMQRLDAALRAEYSDMGGQKGVGRSFEDALAQGLLSMPEDIADELEPQDKLQSAADLTAENTRSIAEILSGRIAQGLEWINGGVEWLGNMFSADMDDDEQTRRTQARIQSMGSARNQAGRSAEFQDRASSLRRKYAQSGEEIPADVLNNIQSMEAHARTLARVSEFHGERSAALSSGADAGGHAIGFVPRPVGGDFQTAGPGGLRNWSAEGSSEVGGPGGAASFSEADYIAFMNMGLGPQMEALHAEVAAQQQSVMTGGVDGASTQWARYTTGTHGLDEQGNVGFMSGEGNVASQEDLAHALLRGMASEDQDNRATADANSISETKAIDHAEQGIIAAIRDQAKHQPVTDLISFLEARGATSQEIRGTFRRGRPVDSALAQLLRAKGTGAADGAGGWDYGTEEAGIAERAGFNLRDFIVREKAGGGMEYIPILSQDQIDPTGRAGGLAGGPLQRGGSGGGGPMVGNIVIQGDPATIVKTLNQYMRRRRR